jgi:hypothetical protein
VTKPVNIGCEPAPQVETALVRSETHILMKVFGPVAIERKSGLTTSAPLAKIAINEYFASRRGIT